MKRTIVWILALLMLAPLLFAGVTILATRLINHEAIKDRIAAAVSKDLGGTITYERVSLAILPRPQVVLTNLSIAVPGSVETTSRSLKIGFELVPLLVGKARLADVRLDHPDVTLVLGNEDSTQGTADAASSGRSLAAVLGWLAATMPHLTIRIDDGRLAFNRGRERVFALEDASIRVAMSPDRSAPTGSGATDSAQPFLMIGSARGVLERATFPEPVRLRIGAFEARPTTLTFSDTEVQTFDVEASVSGRFDDYLTPHPTADFTVSGSVGSQMMQWVRTNASIPEELLLRPPLSIPSAHVVWTPGDTVRMTGSAAVHRDVSVTFDVRRTPDHLAVDEFTVRDKDSQAAVTMDLRNRVLRLSFAGHLAHQTLARIFEQQHVKFGSLQGDFRAQIVLDRPRDSTAHGRLEGVRLVLPVRTPVPVFIDRIVAQASEQTLTVQPLVITVEGIQHTVRGRITTDAEQWLLDLNLDHLAWKTLEALFGSENDGSDPPAAKPPDDAQALRPVPATIRIAAGTFTVGRWTAAPARADIAIGPHPLKITLHQAVVCGITLAGSATIATDTSRIALAPSAQGQDLKPSLECLVGKPMGATGTFDLSGQLSATGAGKILLNDLNGGMALSVTGGRFYAKSAAVRILSYLNVTDLLRGSLPDPGDEGVPYKSLVVRGTAQHGRLMIDEAVLASSVAQMAARGSLDLGKQLFDITVLVAPLTTVDAVVKRIPLVRDILGGSLVTIPVRVTGPFDHPNVDAVPPAAVAKELGGIMERTLKLPFTIMAPVIPGGMKSHHGDQGARDPD